MVKGVSRQVVMVKPPEPKLFEQAIFIMREDAVDYTDEMLLKEAAYIAPQPKRRLPGPVWACCGAAVTGLIWLMSILI